MNAGIHTKLLSTLLFSILAVNGQSLTGHDSLHPDERFKVDLLLVVAHPDDESEIGAYLARASFDEHRRIAVVYGTRGNSGGNAWGQEQGAALAAIREIEGRRALAFLGITSVWFLDGPDTPGQDVLRSLETWDHSRALGRLVRILRLTRPDVVATWLPAYTAGENHGDHQAAGVLAIEAFDIAADPTQFAEQITPPRDARDISNLTEGLHPWQAQKLYFFSDSAHTDFLDNLGPRYSAAEISPSKKVDYAHLAAEEVSFHLTQGDSGYAARVALDKGDLHGTYFADDSRFVFGKSLVQASKTGDLFEGVSKREFQYTPPKGYGKDESKNFTLTLGGPWQFYSQFCPAHDLTHLTKLVPPEVLAGVNTKVSIPFVLTNSTEDTVRSEMRVKAPSGWKVDGRIETVTLKPLDRYAGRVVLTAPGQTSSEWQNITLDAGVAGSQTVRVQVGESSLPQ